MDNQKLEELKKAAKEYCDKERKILNAELEFIEAIIKTRGKNSLNSQNVNELDTLIVKSLGEFLNN